MSSETQSAILGGLADGVVGAVLGFIFALLLFRLTQKRKIVEYSVSSMSLLRLKPSNDNVFTISVSKEALTGDPADHNEIFPLNTVYGFQIILNVGNEDIEKIDDIEIRLDAAARIVRCETEPLSTPGYTIITQKDPKYFNVLHLSMPYLNAKTRMVIRLITTENAESSCTVNAHGLGIKTKLANPPKFNLYNGIGLGVAFVGVGLTILDAFVHHVPILFTDTLGWISLTLIAFGIAITIFMRRSLNAYYDRQEFSQDWDWELPEVSNEQNYIKVVF
jgi:hypothetical protein